MTIFMEKPAFPVQFPGESLGPPTDFAANMTAAYDAQMLARNSDSRVVNLVDHYQPIVDALNDGLPRKDRLFNPVGLGDAHGGSGKYAPRVDSSRGELEQKVWDRLAEIRAVDHNAFPNLPQSKEDMMSAIQRNVLAALDKEQRTAAAADPWGKVGAFVGAAGAAITDPPNLYSMLIGAGQVNVLRTMAVEALIGGSVEVFTQTQVADYYETLGIEYTAADFLGNVAGAAAGAGVIAGGIKLSAKGVAKTWNAVNNMTTKEVSDILDQAGVKTSEADEILRASEIADQVDGENPLADDVFSNQTYRDVIGAVEESVENGRISDLEFSSMIPQKPLSKRDLEGRVWLFEPDELLVDPKAFQFKAEAEAAGGVSRRLEGVAQWDPVKAGQVVVYETLDGKQFIVDGHQRLALAKRIGAADPAQDIKLTGQLLSEADGVTPETARVIAASKNIAEGTGSAIDAAKILRVDPTQIPGLPRTSALVRQARALADLSPDGFGMVINEVVPANIGAAVGRIAADNPDLHPAILSILAKAEPKTIAQAEQIVRDVLAAGQTKTQQLGLFGAEDLTVSLFADRARILDNATAKMRNDQRVFSTLINDAENIEAAGNKLQAATNLQRKEQNVKSLQALQALAHRKGPISDALTAAARQHADGKPIGAVVDGFIDSVRRRAELGDFEGFTTRPSGGFPEPTTRDPAGAGTRAGNQLEDLERFSDPEGQAVADQVESLRADLVDDDLLTITGVDVDDLGNVNIKTGRASDVIDEIDADREFIEQLEICAK